MRRQVAAGEPRGGGGGSKAAALIYSTIMWTPPAPAAPPVGGGGTLPASIAAAMAGLDVDFPWGIATGGLPGAAAFSHEAASCLFPGARLARFRGGFSLTLFRRSEEGRADYGVVPVGKFPPRVGSRGLRPDDGPPLLPLRRRRKCRCAIAFSPPCRGADPFGLKNRLFTSRPLSQCSRAIAARGWRPIPM